MDDKLFAKALMTFDHTYEPQIQMYDHLPYQRDIDVCDWKKPRMSSGNIVKFYQYNLGKPQIIQNDFVVEIEEPEPETDLPDSDTDTEDLGELLVASDEDTEISEDEIIAEEPSLEEEAS